MRIAWLGAAALALALTVPPALAQDLEVKWTEVSSGSKELALGESFDLDFGDTKASGPDFQFEPWEGGAFWAPKVGCTVASAGVADYASFDMARADVMAYANDRLNLCGGGGAPLAPGTILIARTNEVRFSKVSIDACGETLKLRWTTYDRTVVKPTPVATGLDAPSIKSPGDGVGFEHNPRDLLLAWGLVPGAATYTLELDCKGCCPPRKELFCAEQENGRVFMSKPGLTTSAYYTIWLGPYAGKWRVCGVKADGTAGPWSPWTSFSFKK